MRSGLKAGRAGQLAAPTPSTRVFTQPGSEADIGGRLGEVCFTLKNGHPQASGVVRFVPWTDDGPWLTATTGKLDQQPVLALHTCLEAPSADVRVVVPARRRYRARV